MYEFTLVQKYCGTQTTIEGYSLENAMKKNNLNKNLWILIEKNEK